MTLTSLQSLLYQSVFLLSTWTYKLLPLALCCIFFGRIIHLLDAYSAWCLLLFYLIDHCLTMFLSLGVCCLVDAL